MWDDIDLGYGDPDWGLIDEMPMPDFGQSPDLDTSILDDPYVNWGGGAGGDGTNGSGDFGGGLGGFRIGDVGSLLKSLGLAGKDGSLDIGSLLGLVALLGGGINSGNAIDKASGELKDAANKSNEFGQAQYDKAQGRFEPFIAAGTGALAQLQQPMTPLADKFKSQGVSSNLAGKFGNSLASLARR